MRSVSTVGRHPLSEGNNNPNNEISGLTDEELRKLALKPLADPVIEAMFANEDVAGLAAQSLVNAVLEIDGDPTMGKVIRLSTQKTAPNILYRGYRLDIECLSEKELSDTEVQLTPMNMVNRGFLHAGQLAGINAKRGDTMREVLNKMPRILMINLNWFEDRPKHPDFTQPVDLIYRKPDPETHVYQTASDKVHIYNVEIPKFIRKFLPDLKSKPYDPKAPRLHYWLWALTESQVSGVSLTEVISMSDVLQEFVKNDKGFEQYTERYEDVSGDLAVRRVFAAWTAERDILDIVRAEGDKLRAEKDARNFLSLGVAPEIVAQALEMTLEEVLELAPDTNQNSCIATDS